MKNTITILLVALLLCGCVAKQNETNNNINNDTNNEINSEKNDSEKNQEKETLEVDGWSGSPYGNTHSNIYCRIPVFDGLRFNDGYSKGLFKEINDGAYLVALTCGTKETSFESLLEMFSSIAIKDIDNHCRSDSIEYKAAEKKTINGIETIHFIGTMRETRESRSNYGVDLFVTGYLFIVDNTTVGVWGTVYDKDQPQDSIDFVNETVDFMMKSITIEPAK